MSRKSGWLAVLFVMAFQGVSATETLAANLTERDRPSSLVCTYDFPGVRTGNQPIEIRDLDTAVPYLVGMDASTDQVVVEGSTLEIISNNGCDNNFDIVFVTYDLLKMKRGETQSIRGFLSFFNGDGIQGTAFLECK